MKKLLFAIVEDEKEAANVLADHFTHFLEEEKGVFLEWKVFSSGDDFVKSDMSVFDGVFMDIEMPGLNGIETARALHKKCPECIIIFVTNLAKYAINGYEVGAMDYILKPLYYEDFKMRMYRVLTKFGDDHLTFSIITQNDVVRFDSRDILYIESNAHKIIFHTLDAVYSWTRPSMKVLLNGSVKTIKQTNMQTYEDLLVDYGFSKCNSGYLINLAYCKSINGSELLVGQDRLQISRGRKKEFMDDFIRYIVK